jgi:hypothetical protein
MDIALRISKNFPIKKSEKKRIDGKSGYLVIDSHDIQSGVMKLFINR